MVTPCPLCHLSLDAGQSKLEKQTGKAYGLPILHLAQLVGVAAGLDESELKFKRHVVSMARPCSRRSKLADEQGEPTRLQSWPVDREAGPPAGSSTRCASPCRSTAISPRVTVEGVGLARASPAG